MAALYAISLSRLRVIEQDRFGNLGPPDAVLLNEAPMYCTKCGVQLNESARFCSECGNPTARNAYSPQPPYPKLSRPRDDRKVAGVCGGLARYFGVDPTLMRIIFVIFTIWPPLVGLIAYIVCWCVMPEDPLRLPEAPTHSETATGQA
jgi:phage shock protein C